MKPKLFCGKGTKGPYLGHQVSICAEPRSLPLDVIVKLIPKDKIRRGGDVCIAQGLEMSLTC